MRFENPCEGSLWDNDHARVIAEARTWIGAPYHPQGDIKGVGVDCGMLLVRIFVDHSLVGHARPIAHVARAFAQCSGRRRWLHRLSGCDHTMAACQNQFNNLVNFRGFPYMPGNDAITSYPTSGQVMDGGSRYGN